ncbi:hypothetical protein AB0G04_18760 [Actinoplanes sp. NPDC023801]|uniref:hypothetical protein n=1 Tax=Actinoplanes sp. NPDC023801 TaxID=3154595 RepID=UPI0033D68355
MDFSEDDLVGETRMSRGLWLSVAKQSTVLFLAGVMVVVGLALLAGLLLSLYVYIAD